MSWSKGRLLPVGAAVLFAVLVTPPAATAGEDVLIRLPLHLDGDVRADMQGGAIAVRADDGAPKVDLLLTAAHARLLVTNYSEHEAHNAPDGVADLVNGPTGGTDPITRDLDNVRFDVEELRDDFGLFLFDGAQVGATYHASAIETPARLDVRHETTALSYTDDPGLRDFKRVLEPNALVFGSPGMRYEVRGDFNIVIHGAKVLAHSETLSLYQTGTWTETTSADGILVEQPITTTTTTQYVRAELKDAVLTLVATGGDQSMYAHAENITVDVDGSMHSGRAAGQIQFNNETVRSAGDDFEAYGQFRLAPYYVADDADNKEVLFDVEGGFDSLSVGRTTYLKDEQVLTTVAAVSGSVLGLVGLAYVWKAGLLLPLYAKLTKAKVLDQSTRQQIHHKVDSDPGCQVKQVAEALDISWTTASYHLRVLTKMGLVVAKRQGRHEHFFAAGSPVTQSHALVAALQNKTAKQIVETVLLQPGIIQKDLCERLGIAASTASGHLTKLRDIGALSEEREWKKRRYYAGPALQGLPVHIVGPTVAQPADGVVSAT